MATQKASDGGERSLSNDLVPIIREAQRGDRQACARVVEAAWPEAYRIARSLLHDRATAEDAAQEACVAVLAALSDLKRPEAFRSWLRRIVLREAYRQAGRAGREVFMDDMEVATGAEHGPDAEVLADIRRSVAMLPPEYRFPIILKYRDGLTSREIAQALGIPAGTVRFRLSVAIRKLRQALSGTSECSDVTPDLHPNPATGGRQL